MVIWDVLASHEAMRAWHAERLSAHAADLAGLRAARARLHARLAPDPNPYPATQPGGAAAAREALEGGGCAGLSAADRLQADCTAQVRVDGAAGKMRGERLGVWTGVAGASVRPAGSGLPSVHQAKLGQAHGSPESSMVNTRSQPDGQPVSATQASVSTMSAAPAGVWQQGAIKPPGPLAPGGAAAAGEEALVHGCAGGPKAGAPADGDNHKDALHELQVRRKCTQILLNTHEAEEECVQTLEAARGER